MRSIPIDLMHQRKKSPAMFKMMCLNFRSLYFYGITVKR